MRHRQRDAGPARGRRHRADESDQPALPVEQRRAGRRRRDRRPAPCRPRDSAPRRVSRTRVSAADPSVSATRSPPPGPTGTAAAPAPNSPPSRTRPPCAGEISAPACRRSAAPCTAPGSSAVTATPGATTSAVAVSFGGSGVGEGVGVGDAAGAGPGERARSCWRWPALRGRAPWRASSGRGRRSRASCRPAGGVAAVEFVVALLARGHEEGARLEIFVGHLAFGPRRRSATCRKPRARRSSALR